MRKSLLLLVVSALALSACGTSQSNNAAQEQVAATESGIDQSLMDKSVAPGDDFDKYANGAWEKNTQIPADKSNISVFSVIADQADKNEAELINGIVNSNPAAGSDQALIAD